MNPIAFGRKKNDETLISRTVCNSLYRSSRTDHRLNSTPCHHSFGQSRQSRPSREYRYHVFARESRFRRSGVAAFPVSGQERQGGTGYRRIPQGCGHVRLQRRNRQQSVCHQHDTCSIRSGAAQPLRGNRQPFHHFPENGGYRYTAGAGNRVYPDQFQRRWRQLWPTAQAGLCDSGAPHSRQGTKHFRRWPGDGAYGGRPGPFRTGFVKEHAGAVCLAFL